VDAVLRRACANPLIGYVLEKQFDGYPKPFTGIITEVVHDDEDGSKMFHVTYEDNDEEDITEGEATELMGNYCRLAYQVVVKAIKSASDYLEGRITGTCSNQMYSYSHTHAVFDAASLSDPSLYK